MPVGRRDVPDREGGASGLRDERADRVRATDCRALNGAVRPDHDSHRRPVRLERARNLPLRLQQHWLESVAIGLFPVAVRVSARDQRDLEPRSVRPSPARDLREQGVARATARIGEHQQQRPAERQQRPERTPLTVQIGATRNRVRVDQPAARHRQAPRPVRARPRHPPAAGLSYRSPPRSPRAARRFARPAPAIEAKTTPGTPPARLAAPRARARSATQTTLA